MIQESLVRPVIDDDMVATDRCEINCPDHSGSRCVAVEITNQEIIDGLGDSLAPFDEHQHGCLPIDAGFRDYFHFFVVTV